VSNDEDYREIREFFESSLPKYKIRNLGFKERLYLYKAMLWYSLITQDFVKSYKYAQKWVDLFDDNPKMKKSNPVFYLKGINYLLESLFLNQHLTKFRSTLKYFEAEINSQSFTINENTESLAFLYLYLNKINLYFLEGNFDKGIDLIPEVLDEIENFNLKIDEHHVMVFYYKFASLYFGASRYEECIMYLDKIIRNKKLIMREDLLCFSRILNLVAHYEAGLDQNLEALIKSTYKFLLKMNELHLVQQRIIAFLRNLSNIYPHELKQAFIQLHQELKPFENHPYEKRSFMYLDIISWLESRIENVGVESIIRKKSKTVYK
jgi:tetratricopeptide (TPR) repeat protein